MKVFRLHFEQRPVTSPIWNERRQIFEEYVIGGAFVVAAPTLRLAIDAATRHARWAGHELIQTDRLADLDLIVDP